MNPPCLPAGRPGMVRNRLFLYNCSLTRVVRSELRFMAGSLSAPSKKATSLKRVAILFAGGPAPAANAVISTAAAAFQRNDIEVLGILHGYSSLATYSPEKPLEEDTHYVRLRSNLLKRSRSSQGIMIGTARTNPGKDVSHPSHLDDPQLSAPLRRVHEALLSLGVDALISIG